MNTTEDWKKNVYDFKNELTIIPTVRIMTRETNAGPSTAVNWSTNQKAGCIRVSKA